MGLVVGAVAAGLAVALITVLVLGPIVGATFLIVLVALVLLAYVTWIGPWHRRWGAARVKSRWRCPETTYSPSAPDRPRAR